MRMIPSMSLMMKISPWKRKRAQERGRKISRMAISGIMTSAFSSRFKLGRTTKISVCVHSPLSLIVRIC
jgi:asparagine synthetase B (glutamine-hydrolysing)